MTEAVVKQMTETQKQFCTDVVTAMRTWNEHHEDFKMTEVCIEKQQKLIQMYKESDKTVDVELTYYRGMNKLLKEISGVCIKEPPGTGDPFADFDRAMKILG